MTSKELHALGSNPSLRTKIAKSTSIILAIASGLSVANVYYNQPLLPAIGRSFHLSIQQIGFIPTLTQVGYAVGLLLLVPLGDLVERRRLILTVVSCLVFASAAAALSPQVIWLAIASMVLGFNSIVAHLIIPMVAQLTSPAERGKVIGTLISGLILSLLLARSISGTVGYLWGWQTMYWIGAGLMLAVGLALRQRLPKSPPVSKLSYGELMQSLVHLAREQPILREAALNNALLFGSFNAFWVTLVFFLESPPYHYDSRVAGLFGLIGVVGAITSPIAGRLTDRFGARLLVGIGIGFTFSAFIIFWLFGTHLAGLIVGTAVIDLGVHIAYLCNQVRIYNLVPNAESRLNTVYMVTNYCGGAAGSFLGTYCWSLWHWPGVCALGCSLLTIAAIVHWMTGWKPKTHSS